MEASKKKAPISTLRDYRIDQALPPPPSQSIKTRQSTLSEWDQTPEAQNTEMWQSWENELGAGEQNEVAAVNVAPNRAKNMAKGDGAEADESQLLKDEEVLNYDWATELASSERQAERQGIVDYTNAFHKQELLKKQTREFTGKLQSTFRSQVEIFNHARKSSSHLINIYKVNNTAEDFMLFRNGVKLIISGHKAGKISFAFNQYLGQLYAPATSPILELSAEWGPFEQLHWIYKNEKVQPEEIVRYFLTEFCRQSFR